MTVLVASVESSLSQGAELLGVHAATSGISIVSVIPASGDQRHCSNNQETAEHREKVAPSQTTGPQTSKKTCRPPQQQDPPRDQASECATSKEGDDARQQG